MFRIFVLALILASLQKIAHADDHVITLTGTIQKFWAGEFDPALIGDACLLDLKTSRGETIGLVLEMEDCLENAAELRADRGLVVVVEDKDQIRDRAAQAILREQSPAERYYRVNYAAVENGLADHDEGRDTPIIVQRKSKTLVTCVGSAGGNDYAVGILKSDFVPTGYASLITMTRSGRADKSIVFEKEVHPRPARDGRLFESGNEFTFYYLQEARRAELKFKMNGVAVALSELKCERESSITYDVVLIPEPRISISN